MREWVNQRSYTIETVCDLELRETDFTDDRLGILLRRLSHDNSWKDIETGLNRHSIRVYQLGVTRVRIDATTNSGYHLVTDDGLYMNWNCVKKPKPFSKPIGWKDYWTMTTTMKSPPALDQDDTKLPQLPPTRQGFNKLNSN